jgi:hypothetical protein
VAIDGGRLVRRPHPLENPDISFHELEQMFHSMPELAFRQEVLAEFIEESGSVFRGVTASIDGGRRANEPPEEGCLFTMGIDLARVQDWTVLTVLDARRRQVYFERFNLVSWERQIERIVDVSGRYKAHVWMDTTGVGDPIFEALSKRIPKRLRPYQFTLESKRELIDALAMDLEAGRLRLMDVPAQTAELLAYSYVITPSRNVRTEAPAGMHDDCVIALALANYPHCRRRGLHLARQGWRSTQRGWV